MGWLGRYLVKRTVWRLLIFVVALVLAFLGGADVFDTLADEVRRGL